MRVNPTGTVAKLTLKECFASRSMRQCLAALAVIMVGVPATSRLWLMSQGAVLAAVLACLVTTLVVLMCFVTGPLGRDLTTGTTMTLLASALRPSQIIAGMGAALMALAWPPALVAGAGILTVTGRWGSLSVAALVTGLVLTPLAACLTTALALACAMWKGADLALFAPWAAPALIGAALAFLVVVGSMSPLGWGLAAVVGAATICLALAAGSALQAWTVATSAR